MNYMVHLCSVRQEIWCFQPRDIEIQGETGVFGPSKAEDRQ